MTWNPSIGAVPMQRLTGQTVDISSLLQFGFYERVYYKKYSTKYPSETVEEEAWFVGIAETVGNYMTFKLLTLDTKKVIYSSEVRSAENPKARNLRADSLGMEPPTKYLKTRSDVSPENDTEATNSAAGGGPVVFDPDDLVGRTFLMNPEEDGQQHRARIVRSIDDHASDLKREPAHIKFVCSVNDDQYEEVLSYAEVLNHIED